MGVVTFTILAYKSNDKSIKSLFLLQHRNNNVAESKNLINAVPSGAFQPSSNEYDPKTDLVDNIAREFEEELFSKPECFDVTDAADIWENPFYKIIRDNTYFLGVGINPQNCFAELLTLSILNLNDEIVRSKFGFNFNENEANDSIMRSISSNFEGEIELRKLTKAEMNNLTNAKNIAPSLKKITSIVGNQIEIIKSEINKIIEGHDK